MDIRFESGRLKVYRGRFDVNTTIFNDTVIDPSIGRNVYSGVKRILVTHGHADHFGDAVAINAKVFAPKHEVPMVEDPTINWRGLFSWAVLPEEAVTPYFCGTGVEVDGFAEDTGLCVPLPGHTPAHVGYLLDNVLVAGDAVHTPEYWERFGVLYYVDPDLMLMSLHRILSLDWDYLVPGHGCVLERQEAERVVKFNTKMLEKVDSIVFNLIPEDGVRLADLISDIAREMGVKGEKALLVIMPALKGHVSSLCRRGLVKMAERDGYIFLERVSNKYRFSRFWDKIR